MDRQKHQRGKAKIRSKRWYERNKGPHNARAKKRYRKIKRDPNLKRREKYRHEYPEKYERMKGRGYSDPAERSEDWRDENKEASMERESVGKRQRWRSPSERRKAQQKYKREKHKRRRYAKQYRRRNKSRIRQYQKRVKNLNRKRVGPKPKSKRYSFEIKELNRFPFAFTCEGEYYFGFVKEIDVDQWEITFYLEGFGERNWDLDLFLTRVIFYRDEDLDEFFDLLDSSVEVEDEETEFDVDVEHEDEEDEDEDEDEGYEYVPMKFADFNGMFYREQEHPRNLDENNSGDDRGVPRGDKQEYPKHKGTNTWIVPQTGQPYDQEPRDDNHPAEKPDFGYVYDNPGSARVIPEGRNFENKKALVRYVTAKYLADKNSSNRVGKVLVGWKVVGYDDGKLISLYDGRRYPGKIGAIHSPSGGLYLGHPKQFVIDYYTGSSEYQDALLTYQYSEMDLIPGSGSPQDSEGEVIVRKARLVKVEVL
jgi:hypothetical protein